MSNLSLRSAFLVLIGCIFIGTASSQSIFNPINPASPANITGEECGTMERHQNLLLNDPDYANARALIENKIQSYLQTASPKAYTVVTVPVVVHVMHKGETVGTGTNISDAQIQSAIDNLTDAYRNIGYNGVDVLVEFVLAKRGPNCASTNGINRINASGLTSGGDNYGTVGITSNNEVAVKNLSKWDHAEYYNVWIVSEIDNNNGGSGVQGYAYFPGAGPTVDGAVMLHNAFGYDPGGTLGYNLKSYTRLNATAVHEFGHAFNLYHTFEGDSNGSTCPSNSNCSTQGDLVCDTDPHIRSASNCPSGTNSCTGSALGTVVNNFMDYSSGTCKDRFTTGQKNRMQAAILAGRSGFINSLAVTTGTTTLTASSCTPATTSLPSGGDLGVQGLQIEDLYSTSKGADNEGGYVDRSCYHTTNLTAGSTYPITVTTGSGNNEDVKVFIDYNNDGDFDDTNELVYFDNQTASSPINRTHTGNVTIWSAAPVVNTAIRMRVRTDFFPNTISTGCSNLTYGQTEDFTITILPSSAPPVADFSASSTSICAGSSISFTDASTNTPTSWSWTFTGGTPSASTSQNPTGIVYNSAGTYAVSLTATNASGSDVETKSGYITVNPAVSPSVSIALTSGTNPGCSGSAVSFTASPVNGGSTPSYQWKVNGVNTGTNNPVFTSSTLNNGDVVSCVMTSNATCASPLIATSNSVTMTVNPSVAPSVSIALTSGSNPTCSGSSVTFTSTPVNGGTSPAYQWKVNGINAGTNSTTFSSTTLANNDVVSCVMTSNVACPTSTTATSNSVTMTVSGNVAPSVSIALTSGSNPGCSGSSVTFTASPVNEGSSPSFQWKVNGVNAGSNSSNFTTSSLSNGDVVSCVLTSSLSCASPTTATSNSVTMTLDQASAPSISIALTSGFNPSCTGAPLTFTASAVNEGGSPAYQWKINGVNAGSNNSSFTTSSLSNGDAVSCVLTSSLTCASPSTATSNTVTMTVNQSSAASVSIALTTGANPTCTGDPLTFTATPVNGGSSPSYQWKVNGINAGSTTSVFSTSSLVNGDVVSCDLVSSLACTSPSNVTSNSISMVVNACGTVQLKPVYCGTTVSKMTDYLYTTSTSGASQWEYEFTNLSTGTVSSYTWWYSMIACSKIPGIQYSTTYSVRVQELVNGVWSGFGPACQITTPGAPAMVFKAAYCGSTVSTMQTYIKLVPVSGVSQYEYEFTNTTNNSVITKVSGYSFVAFSQVPGIWYGTTYSIRARALMGGTWGPYGPPCLVTSPTMPVTQLQASDCGVVLPSMTTVLDAIAISGASDYEFTFTNTSDNTVYTYQYYYPQVSCAQVTGVQPGFTYSVTVRALINGTFTSVGAACLVTTPAPALSQGGFSDPLDRTSAGIEPKAEANFSDFRMIVYPNPVSGNLITVSFRGLDASAHGLLLLTDITGRQIKTISVDCTPGNFEKQIEVEGLTRGVYMLTFTGDGVSRTERLVVQ